MDANINPNGIPSSTMIIFVSPFHITPLFYFKRIIHSELLKGLCDCALKKSDEQPKFYKTPLATKHQFHLCHILQDKAKALS